MALLVRVRDGSGAPEQTHFFSTAPVRLGRNPLNDLLLDYGFVSQWHGLIKFDRDEVLFVDLGSTNGTLLDGDRVQERIPVSIPNESAILSIGSVQIRVEWADSTEPGVASTPRVKTQFHTSLPLSGGAPLSEAWADAPGAAAVQASSAPLEAPLTAVQQAQGAYRAYRQGWEQLLGELRQKIESAPPAMREMTAFFMASEFPQVTREPEFGRMLTDLGVDRVMAGCFDLEEWLARLTHHSADSSPKKLSPALAMEQVGAILEVFVDSFIELRRGYSQFEKEMGLQINYEPSPLHRAATLEEVIAHLMDVDANRADTLNELRRAFADFAMHQVALIGASVEGARELLESLAPSKITGDEPPSRVGGGNLTVRRHRFASVFVKAWPFASLISWARYVRQYEATTEEDRFTRKLFGRRFIRAYLALIGGQNGK